MKNTQRTRASYFERPHLSRRQFFQVAGAGVTVGALSGARAASPRIDTVDVQMQNKAKNVVFILLAGAASHVDTFDFKETPATPLDRLKPETIDGLAFPTGLLPNLAANNLPDICIVRSMRAWALVHSLSQTWAQIGRSPAAALGAIAPNIGSIVALEKEPERQANQAFPTFLALNSPSAVGAGYQSAMFAPFKTTPAATGLRNTANPDGAARLEDRWSLLHAIDDPLRVNSPLGKPPEDTDNFYSAARRMMYNPAVDQAFRFDAASSQRYGVTAFGNACLIARQVLKANQGTRFIQITLGGWDMHTDIYGTGQNARAGNIFILGKQLDDGLSALLTDMKADGTLNETLVVMQGEFGRTTGALSAAGGRDHYLQQFCVFAGAGVKGGRAIGATDAAGASTIEHGWSRERDVKPEDIEATIYSALGINWTSIRYDDPFNRGFEYVPYAHEDVYGPINELWG